MRRRSRPDFFGISIFTAECYFSFLGIRYYFYFFYVWNEVVDHIDFCEKNMITISFSHVHI